MTRKIDAASATHSSLPTVTSNFKSSINAWLGRKIRRIKVVKPENDISTLYQNLPNDIKNLCISNIDDILNSQIIRLLQLGEKIPDGMLEGAKNVIHLSIKKVTLSDAQLIKLLSYFKKLKILEMPECVTDKGLRELSRFDKLETLDLSNCINITDFGLSCISNLDKLVTLDLSNCENITSFCGYGVNQLNSLQHVIITGCKKINIPRGAVFSNLGMLEKSGLE